MKKLADAAQVSVGMDWTWLDDVTAKDWQRYHDLIRGQLPCWIKYSIICLSALCCSEREF